MNPGWPLMTWVGSPEQTEGAATAFFHGSGIKIESVRD